MSAGTVDNPAPPRARLFATQFMRIRRLLHKVWCHGEMRWALATDGAERLLRRRFNRWARQGRGQAMERDHARIAETIWERMELSAEDRILDLGCGEGWACRLLAERAPQGCLIMGVDFSDQMIRLAREKSRPFSNVSYYCGQAEQIPAPSDYFTKVFSIEAFYYFQDQNEVLRELLRIMQPGGELNLLICLFGDDPKDRKWFDDVGMPVHNRSLSEYQNMLEHDGWIDVDCRVFDFALNPFSDANPHDRPLLITARKPS